MYERGETMVYRIRRIKLDNMAEICWRAKRCETYLTLQNLHIGGIYQLHGGKLSFHNAHPGMVARIWLPAVADV